ncbi:ricin-type beta-trefoil lectin domain protein, partial [Kitasatospora cineracea]
HTPATTTNAVTTTGFDLTPTAPGLICKGDAGAPVWRTENNKPMLVGIVSRAWQGGCLDTPATETRTTAHAERTDDLGTWITAQTSRSYEILNPASDRCLNLKGAGPWGNGTAIIAWDCTIGANNEKFTITADGLLRNPTSGLCLNLYGAGPWNNGNPVVLWDCNTSWDNEKFEWTADGQLRNPASGRCLNLTGSGPWNNGNAVALFDCLGQPNSKFRPIVDSEIPHPVGRIQNPVSNRCLNISGAGPTWPNNTPIILFDCNGENNELFQLTADGLLYNYSSNRCLNLSGAGPWNNGNAVILFDCNASWDNEKFEWTATGQLRNPASGRCLNVSGAGPVWNNSTPIILFDCNGDANEKFQLIGMQA